MRKLNLMPFLFCMLKKTVIKCYNTNIHRRNNGEGHILIILGNDSIYLHCSDRACKRWTKLKISFPGIKINFSKAAVIQTLMPENYHFDINKAAVIIGDTDE